MSSFAALLGRVSAGENLDRDDMTAAMTHIMSGQADEREIGLFLTTLAAKGETAEEIAGAAIVMRRHMTPIRSRHATLLDTCGTGGGGSELFNISTTAALVIALKDPNDGLAWAIGILPAAMVGMAPTRRGRANVVVVGALFAISIVVGSFLAQAAVLAVGGIATSWLVVMRLFFGVGLADRPALILSTLLVVLGIQIIAVGLIGEIITFAYAREIKDYKVDRVVE